MADSKVEPQKPCYWDNLGNLFNALAEYIISVHINPDPSPHQAIIRFHNDYGVRISPLSHLKEKQSFEILVLRFYGLGFNDYETAQYALVPEINWVHRDEDILAVCRQVSLLRKGSLALSLPESRLALGSPLRLSASKSLNKLLSGVSRCYGGGFNTRP